MKKTAALLVAAVVASGCGAAVAKPTRPVCRDAFVAPGYRDAVRTVRPLVPKLRTGIHAPGLALSVAVDGAVVWSATCGYADRERRVAVARTTRFRIGSVSKPLTAAALARLVDRGTVDLDAPVQRYVPAFPEKQWPVTIRALASHTAGIRANQADELVNRRHYPSVAAELPIFADDPLLFRPGTQYSYSNWGYVLVGAALEGAAGQPFADVVRAEVTGPLRLSRTVLEDVTHPVAGRAKPYELDARNHPVPAPAHDVSWRWPAGGFLSTADDLARFGSAFVDGRFVSPETLREFTTGVKTADGRETRYALGWETHATPFGAMLGHTGNTVGGTAAIVVSPSRRVALALTSNVGYVTAANPKVAPGTPEPPQLLLPFLALRSRR